MNNAFEMRLFKRLNKFFQNHNHRIISASIILVLITMIVPFIPWEIITKGTYTGANISIKLIICSFALTLIFMILGWPHEKKYFIISEMLTFLFYMLLTEILLLIIIFLYFRA